MPESALTPRDAKDHRTASATYATPGARLRAWRIWMGFTQLEAAKEVKASPAAWSMWESGEKTPNSRYQLRLELLTKKIRPDEWDAEFGKLLTQVVEARWSARRAPRQSKKTAIAAA
jgi:transcriptional regulator with XRE-family HTH domain